MQCHLTQQLRYFPIGKILFSGNVIIYSMGKGEAGIFFDYMHHDPLASNVNSLLRIKAIEERIKVLGKGNESEISILERALKDEAEWFKLLDIPPEINAIPLNQVTMEELIEAYHDQDYDFVASLCAGLILYRQKD